MAGLKTPTPFDKMLEASEIRLTQYIVERLKFSGVQSDKSDTGARDLQKMLQCLSDMSLFTTMDFYDALYPLIVDSYACHHLDQAIINKGSRTLFIQALVILLESKLQRL